MGCTDDIAETYFALAQQSPLGWSNEVDIRPFQDSLKGFFVSASTTAKSATLDAFRWHSQESCTGCTYPLTECHLLPPNI